MEPIKETGKGEGLETVFNKQELQILQGVSYDRLPERVVISPMSLRACTEVWDAYITTPPPEKFSKAHSRMFKHYTRLAAEGDRDATAHLQKNLEPAKSRYEFGKQIYSVRGKVIEGVIHMGNKGWITLRKRADGIDDRNSVVHVHNHLANHTFSIPDIVSSIGRRKDTPDRCFYFVVGPSKLHLIFPTLETPYIEGEELREKLKVEKTPEYDRALNDGVGFDKAQTILIKEKSRSYKFGFYIGNKDGMLDRVS